MYFFIELLYLRSFETCTQMLEFEKRIRNPALANTRVLEKAELVLSSPGHSLFHPCLPSIVPNSLSIIILAIITKKKNKFPNVEINFCPGGTVPFFRFSRCNF